MKLQIIVSTLALCFSFGASFSITPNKVQVNVLSKSSFSSSNTSSKSNREHSHFQIQASAEDEGLEQDSAMRGGIDKAWKHVKKPLLRIGGKGISDSHGNSLKELLNAHTVVKVKINSTKLGSFEDVFEALKAVVERVGDMKDLELLHIRKSENTLLIGKGGTMENIRIGAYPPPPPPPRVQAEEE